MVDRSRTIHKSWDSVLGRHLRRDYRFCVYIMQSVSGHALYIG